MQSLEGIWTLCETGGLSIVDVANLEDDLLDYFVLQFIFTVVRVILLLFENLAGQGW